MMFYKTMQDIKLEAIEKYKRISDEKKATHLSNRKKAVKKFHIMWACVSVICGVASVIFSLIDDSSKLLMFGIVLLALTIGIIVAMIITLHKSDEALIISELEKVLKLTYSTVDYHKLAKCRMLVEQNSPMCQEIKELNSQYNFDTNICRTYTYDEHLSSKRQFDSFNYMQRITNEIKEKMRFFERLRPTYESNVAKYNEYLNKYNGLKKFREEIEIENLEVEYEIFNYLEREFFKENIKPEIEAPRIIINISYISPSGRNKYFDSRVFTYADLLKIINDIKITEEQQFKEKEEKERLKKEKRDEDQKKKKQAQEKERKLKELEKLEKQLAKKEQELNDKEKEFLEATKEHIYAPEFVETQQEPKVELKEESTITEKLKFLRKQFDEGEITYEEYKNKRKELM